jgi:hypothetical protein
VLGLGVCQQAPPPETAERSSRSQRVEAVLVMSIALFCLAALFGLYTVGFGIALLAAGRAERALTKRGVVVQGAVMRLEYDGDGACVQCCHCWPGWEPRLFLDGCSAHNGADWAWCPVHRDWHPSPVVIWLKRVVHQPIYSRPDPTEERDTP